MAPAHTFNGEPIAWHALSELATPPETYDLCRCGASAHKPFCDRSHEACRFDGAETASRRPFRERAQTWRRGHESLADDKPLCVQAGFCKTRTTGVWSIFEESDEAGKRDLMREMVWRCPSGRLVLLGADGFPEEPFTPQEIAVVPGGPLWVRGGIPILGAEGMLWEPRNRVTLCRCGASQNKPFCDATHARIGFDER